ncbi:hypothetical protein cand_008750 [Cryptosporidium andersoni]|uniref:Uncharacterized protein n=1 Tax=Cryptosporidium andersoni TaxID=117008 RepID=A0A1J4MP52_9CRYT|nr:hypothetical protein cand_008750 [Cryptosporidium andersoni]
MICKYICLSIYYILIFNIYYSSGEVLAAREAILDWVRLIVRVDNSVQLLLSDIVSDDPEEAHNKDVIERMLVFVEEIYAHLKYFRETFEETGVSLNINTMYDTGNMNIMKYGDILNNILIGIDDGNLHREECLNRLKNLKTEVNFIQQTISDYKHQPIERLLHSYIMFLKCDCWLVKHLCVKIEDAIDERRNILSRGSSEKRTKFTKKGSSHVSDKNRKERVNTSKEEYKRNQEEVSKLMSQLNLDEGETYSDDSVRRKDTNKKKEKKKEKKKDNQKYHDNNKQKDEPDLYSQCSGDKIVTHDNNDNKKSGDHSDSELGATGFDPSYNRRGGDHSVSELGATGFDPSYNRRGGDYSVSELGATGFDPSYNRRGGDHSVIELGATGFDPSYNRRGGDYSVIELGATGFDPSFNRRGGDHSSVTTTPQEDVNLLLSKQELVEKRRKDERDTIINTKKREIQKYKELIVFLEEEIEEFVNRKVTQIEQYKQHIATLKKEVETIKLRFLDLYGITDDINLYGDEGDSVEESDEEEKKKKYIYPAVYV